MALDAAMVRVTADELDSALRGARVEKIYSHFDVKPLPINANIYASAKQHLIENGQAIDDFDILIAATAMDSDITVVTDNEKHFNRIPNLKIENWLR